MTRTVRLAATLTAVLAALGVTGRAAHAQGRQPSYQRELSAKLTKQAKISEDSAATIARSRVPNGIIRSVELEEEKGKLQYSYDIKVPGRSGIEEVNVNALDGTLIGVEHESPAAERKEAVADKKAKKP
jgi:uncharacterized membrane protein YkoI